MKTLPSLLLLAALLLAPALFAQEENALDDTLASSAEEIASTASGKLNDTEPQGSEAITTYKGSRFSGTFKAFANGKILFADDDAGDLELEPDAINGYRLNDPVEVHFQRHRRDDISMGLVEVRDDQLWLSEDDGNVEQITTAEYYKLQRDAYSRWNYSGSISSLLFATDGNTEQLGYGLFAFFKADHPYHVITFAGEALYGETENVRSQQRAQAMLEYNYMFLEKLGLLAREIVEHDDFKRLRTGSITTLGVTSPVLVSDGDYKINVDGGVIYVAQDYKGAPDKEFFGGELGVNGEMELNIGVKVVGASRAYFNFKDKDDVFMKNRLSVNFLLFESIASAIVFEHDYDNQPAPGVERNDYRLAFLLGWSF